MLKPKEEQLRWLSHSKVPLQIHCTKSIIHEFHFVFRGQSMVRTMVRGLPPDHSPLHTPGAETGTQATEEGVQCSDAHPNLSIRPTL